MEDQTAQEFKHAYSGSCKPVNGKGSWVNQATFSVGIFQWVPKASGGLKKSAVKYRIKGRLADEDRVLSRAKEVCTEMDNGTWKSGKKSETVKPQTAPK